MGSISPTLSTCTHVIRDHATCSMLRYITIFHVAFIQHVAPPHNAQLIHAFMPSFKPLLLTSLDFPARSSDSPPPKPFSVVIGPSEGKQYALSCWDETTL